MIPLALVFTTLGGFGLIVALAAILRASSSRRWTRVPGKIIDSNIDTEVTVRRDKESVHIAAGPNLKIIYEYRVDGNTYTGRRIGWNDLVAKPRSSLEQLKQHFMEGRGVDVFVNPRNPHDAVLVPGPGFFNFTIMVPCLVFIATGIVMWIQPDWLLAFLNR